MDCKFLRINDWWVPGLSGQPRKVPIRSQPERTVSGFLRSNSRRVAREWRVNLTSLSGSDADTLEELLVRSEPLPVWILGEEFTAWIDWERVINEPSRVDVLKVLADNEGSVLVDNEDDAIAVFDLLGLRRSDFSLTITEVISREYT